MRKDGDILQQFTGISNLARLKIMSTATVELGFALQLPN